MWYAKNTGGYNTGSTEANDNCTEIYNVLNTLDGGYNFIAVCAIIGNIYRECGYNPWQWENWYGYNSRIVKYSTSSGTYYKNQQGGYGLMQFTPYPPTPYPNTQPYVDSTYAQGTGYYAPNFYDSPGSPTDGVSQLDFMHYQMFYQTPYREWFAQTPGSNQYNAYLNALAGVGIDYTRFYNMTATQFKNGTGPQSGIIYTKEDFIGAFATNYLRPTSTEVARHWQDMINAYNYYHDYLSGITPTPPGPPEPPGPGPTPPTQREHMPVWMMIKYY